jgi:hypothetical protein
MVTFIKSKKFLLILLLLFFVSNSTAFALEIDWPLSPGGTVLNDDSDVGDMVQYFYEWAIALGGLATFVSLVFGGFKYLSSMGRPETMKEAKDQITSAFAGLILLLSAWLILNIINPDLTTFKRESYNLDHIKQQYDSFHVEKMPSCDYVELYPSDGYGGGAMEIIGKEGFSPPDNKRLTIADSYKEMRPLSSRAFTSEALPEFDCPDPDPVNGCPCPEYGCGCVLQLFTTDSKGDPCGEKLGEKSASSGILLREEARGEQITCVKLSGIDCQCRELDAEGECTTNLSVDTAWGDDEFGCLGKNRRCLTGKCITCGGTILKDGCSSPGCAALVMAPESPKTLAGNPSELACWYVGNSADLDLAPSCTDTCKDKAGQDGKCVQANWNDDGSCSTGKQLWGCSGCNWVLSVNSDPGYWGWTDECSYRDSPTQVCSGTYWSFARRFCVCDR